MRFFGLMAVAFLLVSCSAKPPVEEVPAEQPLLSFAVAAHPEFEDTDPFDWPGKKPYVYPVHGIDVARYQGNIDWFSVKNSGVSFAYIKATEGGDHLDEKFAQNWAAAARADIPRGAYHFYYFCRTAAEQANWFIKNVPQDPQAMPPVLDMEWNHGSKTCKAKPSPVKVRSEMSIFLDRVFRHYGKHPVIYVTPDFYQDNKLWHLSGYQFWLRSVANHPKDRYHSQRWVLWQYTSTGVVPGIEGSTDLNVFAGSVDSWKRWLVSNRVRGTVPD